MRDVYLKLADASGSILVKGESADRSNTDWIEVEDFSHGVHQGVSGTASTAGGHPVGRARHDNVTFQKVIDVSSPTLKQFCSGGKTIPEAVFQFYRADGQGNRVMVYEIKLKNVVISDVVYSTGGDGLIRETVSLAYSAISWSYSKQKIGGNQEGKSAGAWNLNKNSTDYSA